MNKMEKEKLIKRYGGDLQQFIDMGKEGPDDLYQKVELLAHAWLKKEFPTKVDLKNFRAAFGWDLNLHYDYSWCIIVLSRDIASRARILRDRGWRQNVLTGELET